MNVLGLVLVAAGVISLTGVVFNLSWYQNTRNFKFFSGIFSHTGARIFYGTFGVALIVTGSLITAGIIGT